MNNESEFVCQSEVTPSEKKEKYDGTIHIQWEGPFTFDESKQRTDESSDYGVYQVYGMHPIYGDGVLLYIGKASKQTFGKRLSQETWYRNINYKSIQIYLGKLGSFGCQPDDSEWEKQIIIAEKMLIFAHAPAVNSSGLHVFLDEEYHDVHVLNWGCRRSLFPEISGKYFSSRFSPENFKIFQM